MVFKVSTVFIGVSGGIVNPSGLVRVSWSGVSYLGMLSVSSSLSAFTGVSGGLVPSGLVRVSGLGVSSLGVLSVSSSLFAPMVSSCIFHC